MKNGKLQAAVIGLGEGFRHIKAFRENPEYELLAVCDVLKELPPVQARRLTEFDLENTTIRYYDYKEVVANKDIDAVFIMSPDFCHC